MRVLISGGGIAGLTLAYWLHRYDIQSVVIEQAKSVRHDGYGIDFFGTGYDVADRMGLIDRLRSRQIPYDYAAYANESGELITKLDTAMMDKFTDGKYMGLMHATLGEVLYEAIEGRVEVRFGRSLTAIEQSPDQVCATFNDGTTESFDLLIGADGVHSMTRTLIFGPEKQFSRFLGYTFACYGLADRYGIGHAWKMYVEPGRLVGAYCSDHEGEIFPVFMYRTDRVEHLPREQRLPRLREVFAGMGWITQKLLSDVPDTETIFMDAVTQIQMPTWHSGRVALVGDACGCPTFMSGQGASLAMGGAYILAEELHETTAYQDAFRGQFGGRVEAESNLGGKLQAAQSRLFLRRKPLPLPDPLLEGLPAFRPLVPAPTWRKLLPLLTGTRLAQGRRRGAAARRHRGNDQAANFSP